MLVHARGSKSKRARVRIWADSDQFQLQASCLTIALTMMLSHYILIDKDAASYSNKTRIIESIIIIVSHTQQAFAKL